GDLVIAGVESLSEGFTLPLCKITEVLGDPDAPGVDVLAIALRYSLPIHFPEEVIRESEQLGDNLSIEIHGNRKDLRGLVTFTIDPVDAKDFDDAISLMRTGDGGYELGVHIADVSYYVSDRTAMDREAEARGMSCYLVDRVLPMLPERVSNDLCSLKPHVDRLTKSVLIQLDAKGTVLSHEIANTVIHSKSRLTYEQVQEFLDGNNKNGDVVIPTEVCEVLITFSELTDLLIKQRTGRGALDFELPEARVLLDDSGKPVNILKNRRFKAHRMVEEAMLLANTITAVTLREHHVPFLYRIHDKPDEAKLAAFGEIASELGYDFRASRAGDDGYIQSFIISISGKKHEQLLNTLLLRSMKKAAYSPINIGHYGLGLSTYAHFTSPIRRYPDLIVHRQLDTYIIHNGKNTGKKDEEYYKNLGNYITEREIITDNAERESTKMKTAEFMKGHLGEEYDGTISGILPLGFFVELDEFYVEGLVHVSSLEDDYYEIERSGIAMSGRNRGRRFVVGERVRILVARADKDRGEVDFFLVEKGKKKAKKSRK
ncbi:MAG: ribonuclease R, partial [Candidatus Latescibacteria bacterium]|nr:ribonuclease R [Candidatus Latescibacterota bacterium]